MKEQYKIVRKQYPAWTRSMVLHYLAGWNGVTLREVKTTLLRELKESKPDYPALLAEFKAYTREQQRAVVEQFLADWKGE